MSSDFTFHGLISLNQFSSVNSKDSLGEKQQQGHLQK